MQPGNSPLGRNVFVTLDKQLAEQCSNAGGGGGGGYSIGNQVPGIVVRAGPGNRCNIHLFLDGPTDQWIEDIPFSNAGAQGTWNYAPQGREAVAA